MKKMDTKSLTLSALLISLTYVATSLIKIPIPFGYVNLGFSMLLIATFFFGTEKGVIAGAIGSGLADLLSPYAIWTLPTFMIKFAIALAIGYILYKKGASKKLYGFRTGLAVFVGVVIHLVGYTIATAIIEGNWYAALTTAPILAIEGVINAIVFYVLASMLRRTKVAERMQE